MATHSIGKTTSDAAEQTQLGGWYERRNRFLDLHLYVNGLQSRVVRTPEMEARRAQ